MKDIIKINLLFSTNTTALTGREEALIWKREKTSVGKKRIA
jgi:hypothetical protein